MHPAPGDANRIGPRAAGRSWFDRLRAGYASGTTNDPDRYRQGEAESAGTVTAQLAAAGFTGSFGARPGGRLLCFTCREESPAAEFHVSAIRRLEGASDPADMVAIVAARCPRCGARGTAELGYGPSADLDAGDVLLALERDDRNLDFDGSPHHTHDRRPTG